MKKWIFFALFVLQSSMLHAASSVLVWPIFQVIEADQNGSALWLENRSSRPVRLQVRVLSWQQQDFRDRYSDQHVVVASPPFATVPPQQRQLVRLMRIGAPPAHGEQAYRIILDEVPDPAIAAEESGVGLRLQMRYVLPLFLYSKGVWTQPRSDVRRDVATASSPSLHWRLVKQQGKTLLQINNQGIVHARLTNVFWGHSADASKAILTLSKGFLGYVLPGQSMRFPLPANSSVPMGTTLYAQLADNGPLVAIAP